MCGRYVDPNLRGTDVEHSELRIDPFPQRFNIKPTNDVLITGADPADTRMARWWLIPSWHRGTVQDWKATTFNARIEDAATKPSFRGPWKYGRCLLPAAGYYEWTGAKGAKQPHFVSSAGNTQTLWIAGLCSPWQDLMTCTMMTRAANDTVRDIHHRMPVILSIEEREAWLRGTQDAQIGAEAKLKHHAVKRFGLHDDDPQLIDPMD